MEQKPSFDFFENGLPRQEQPGETLLAKLTALGAVRPPGRLKEKILGRLGFAGESLSLNNLPATDRYANHLSWLAVINPLLPTEPVETLFMREIRRDERLVQTLVVSKVDVPEEIHAAFTESFFILEGHCICTVGNEVFELSSGDYLEVPLHIPHAIRLLSPKVTAILQYRFD